MKTARDMMTTPVYTVSPETGIQDLARLFQEKKVSGFPVVNGLGTVVGVVTESDLIHQNERLHIPTTVALFDAVLMFGSSKRLEEEFRKMTATTVGEIMNPKPLILSPDATLVEIATLMGERRIHTFPVVDSSGKLVGVIGKRDLIRAMAK